MTGAPASQGQARVLAPMRCIGPASSLAVKAALATLALYLGLTLVTGALPVVIAWLTRLIIDDLVSRAGMGMLLRAAGGLGIAGLIIEISPQVARYLRGQVEREVGLLAHDRLFTAVAGFAGLRRLENPHFLDRLRLAQQAGEMTPSRIIDGILAVVQGSITIGGFLGSLSLLSPLMAALVLASGVPALFGAISVSRRRARMFWETAPMERRELFYSLMLSSAQAAKEVRIFGIGGFLRDRMLAERRSANAARRLLDRREVVIQAGLGLLSAALSGGGLLWAVSAARDGRLSVGDVTLFAAAVAGVQGALASMTTEIAQSHHALLMFDHYVAVTTVGPDLAVATRPRPLPPLRQGIEFRDVWFRYSDDHPWVLRGVNLLIPHGTAMGVVGLNGAGKSTLVKLLCRFYDPSRGSILWDGVDIRDVEPAELRRKIGAVFQDYMHYDMTAAESIALGDLDAIDDLRRIQAAARRAGIHDRLTELPRGYDTLLSRIFFMEPEADSPEAGVVLSGGEEQRLALARAFLRDRRDLVILDEPSAGLDAVAEHEIHASLSRHRIGQTSLLISHRLGAVRDADLIIVIGDGRIVESGDHATLMAAHGEYARLFRMQASGYQAETENEPALTGGP